MAKVTLLKDQERLTEAQVTATFDQPISALYGNDWKEKYPVIKDYLSYFPVLSVMPHNGKLVITATVPQMTLFVKGDDSKRNAMSNAVKKNEDIKPVWTGSNTFLYDIMELYDAISKVGSGSGTGKMSFRRKARVEFFDGLQAELAALLQVLGDAAIDFPSLFPNGDVIDLEDSLQGVYDVADVAWKEAKNSKDVNDDEDGEDEEE